MRILAFPSTDQSRRRTCASPSRLVCRTGQSKTAGIPFGTANGIAATLARVPVRSIEKVQSHRGGAIFLCWRGRTGIGTKRSGVEVAFFLLFLHKPILPAALCPVRVWCELADPPAYIGQTCKST